MFMIKHSRFLQEPYHTWNLTRSSITRYRSFLQPYISNNTRFLEHIHRFRQPDSSTEFVILPARGGLFLPVWRSARLRRVGLFCDFGFLIWGEAGLWPERARTSHCQWRVWPQSGIFP